MLRLQFRLRSYRSYTYRSVLEKYLYLKTGHVAVRLLDRSHGQFSPMDISTLKHDKLNTPREK